MVQHLRPEQFQQLFTVNGAEYEYNRIPYLNYGERAVEVPIALGFLASFCSGEQVCEVGNVLVNYEKLGEGGALSVQRRIIDKYEKHPAVENIDILDVAEEEIYDGVVSVSTVEHVRTWYGDVEGARDREGPLKAVSKIYDLLKPDGRAIITVPFGRLIDGQWYIQFSYEYLKLLTNNYGIPASALSVDYLHRVAIEPTRDNPRQLWQQVASAEVADVEYGVGFPAANAIAIINLRKTTRRSISGSPVPNPPVFRSAPLIGSIFAEGWVHHARPDPEGYFSTEVFGPVLTWSASTPPGGEYELVLVVKMVGPCVISFEATAFFDDNSAGHPLLSREVSASVSIQAHVTLPEGSARVDLTFSNKSENKGRFRVQDLIVRKVSVSSAEAV